ncbi:MAG: energy-coupling factor ABC transporter ATP-binding protein [Propionibacteriaceae bacterium]
MIELKNVNVTVPLAGGGDKTLLSQISIDLAEHRIALIGANGSGKSTLMRLLNGLILPSQGTVSVNGYNTKSDGKKVRQQVGFIFSDALSQLIQVTPVEDIELSLRRVIKDKKQRKEQAVSLLQEQGLERVAHQSIYDLSGGERQLVALTSVLAINPTIVVADEPTTLLDLRNRNIVCKRLASVSQQLIYATHDLDFAAQAERVIWIDSGQVAGDGNPLEIIAAYRKAIES